jgi:hypothetical protein
MGISCESRQLLEQDRNLFLRESEERHVQLLSWECFDTKLCRYAEIAAATLQSSEKAGVMRLVGLENSAICQDELGRSFWC